MEGVSSEKTVSSSSGCHHHPRQVKWENTAVSGRQVADSALFDSDQPIDMSLSSRKRALSPCSKDESQEESQNPSKKLRPTTETTRRKRRKPLRNLAATTINANKSRSALIISPEEYSDEGINNHFRKSLSKYILTSEIGFPEREVDEHFLRSLGWEVWWKLLNQAKPCRNQQNPLSLTSRPSVLVLEKK